MAVQTKFCEKCKKAINLKEFYKTNDYTKYPDGYLNQCKKCLTMHVDNWNPDTFLWILQECDVPYIPDKWNGLLTKYGKDRSQVSGMTIIGRYLAAVKIKPYSDYRWADTQYLQEQADHKTEEAMKRQGYSMSEIDSVIKTNRVIIPEEPLEEPKYASTGEQTGYIEDYFDDGAEDDLGNDLTDEDRLALRLKWGKAYKPEEWVRLEQLYQEMEESYDIQGAGHEDILKLVCKTSLKANQLLDIGDVDGAQKMIKMYDGLMKSGKFTAAQNKTETGECLDSIAELVGICEKEGFIPRYYTDGPKDRVDETILDMKQYTKTLVTEELNLGNLIESAMKQMQIEESKEEDEDIDDEDEITLDDLDMIKEEVSDQDFEDFNDFKENQEKEDEDIISSLLEDDF